MHIKGDGWPAISYGQGFAIAQTRLWQLQKSRLLAKGRLSEIAGTKSVIIDEFFRHIGLARTSEETWEQGLDPVLRESLIAYSNGINDYVKGISLTASERQTGRAMPPEFFLVGITKDSFEPWTPIDCLLMVRLINFTLTWNWASDLQREAARQQHPDLDAIVEELMPFTSDFMVDSIPVVDDDDLQKYGLYSEESLVERYRAAIEHVKSAQPPKQPKKNEQELSSILKEYGGKKEFTLQEEVPQHTQQVASNNFVVHGNYTETGMPMLASDPHLAISIPSVWSLYHLEFPDGKILSGA